MWEEDQEWERKWHDTCANSYWEETKQRVYARKMGLKADMVNGKYPVYSLQNKVVVDIGGGPYSMLLKCLDFQGYVVDPCQYPDWTVKRYEALGIHVIRIPAEDIDPKMMLADEVWIYNCLQHTQDPELIINNALRMSKIIRIFEWIDEPISIGHPQLLTEERLNKALGGIGKTEYLNESGCVGHAYYGFFKGERYEVSSS